MIIGKGMIAKAFATYQDNDIVIFASGVSNSQETNEKNFTREYNLLVSTINENKNSTLVYFSTCSIEDDFMKETLYVKHKIMMEKTIKKLCSKFFIFRLSQVVGYSSSPTLINFIYKSILGSKEFTIYKNATRNIIDVTDVFIISDYLIKNDLYINKTINIASPYNYFVKEIVVILEKIIKKKAIYNYKECGIKQLIDISDILKISKINAIFIDKYISNAINKYYNKG